MKKYIFIALGIALVAFVIFKLVSNKGITENKVYHYDKEAPIEVMTFTLKSSTPNAQQKFSGTFEANREVKVNADIQGKVMEVMVDMGTVVRKGQPLIQLDNALLKLQREAAEVQIESLEKDVARFKILVEADAIQEVQLEKAEQGLKSAKIQRATLQEQIARTTIKAPFDGVITMKMTEAGAFAAPGVPLLQLTEIQQLRFTINVPESDIDIFETNKVYTVFPDNYPNQNLEGKIIAIGSKANPASGFPVQFQVENTENQQIKAGMFGKVIIEKSSEGEGLYIPVSIIQGNEEDAAVYVVKDGRAVLQKISIANKVDDKVRVSEGLKEGDVVINKGFINLFDGANVEIK